MNDILLPLADAGTGNVPTRIYSFWHSGENAAPPVVRLCWNRWRQLNPEYQLTVLDASMADGVLKGLDICFSSMSIQAYSDILRVMLLQQGGIWIDATVFPVLPLRNWIGQDLRFQAFTAPGGDRMLSSWFLAAETRSPLIADLLRRIEAYWAPQGMLCRLFEGPALVSNHRIATRVRKRLCRSLGPHRHLKGPAYFGISSQTQAFDPAILDTVGDKADSRWKGDYPYFWFHYMINAALADSAELSDYIDTMPRYSADNAHAVQRALIDSSALDDKTLLRLARLSPVQKLRWQSDFPLERCRQLDSLL